jgi:hypothetical protein
LSTSTLVEEALDKVDKVVPVDLGVCLHHHCPLLMICRNNLMLMTQNTYQYSVVPMKIDMLVIRSL